MNNLSTPLLALLLFTFCLCSTGRAQIFVTSKDDETIETANLDGSGHRVLIRMDRTRLGPANYAPWAIAATSEAIYWTDTTQDAIYRADHDGTNIRKVIDLKEVKDSSSFPDGIAVSRSAIYWTEAGLEQGIYTADLDGRNARRLILDDWNPPFGYQPNGIVVTDSAVYWSGWRSITQAPAVFRWNFDDPRATKLTDSSSSPIAPGLARGGDRLFWTVTDGSGSPGYIEVANLDGSETRTLINLSVALRGADAVPVGIAANDTSIYWADRGQRAVYTARHIDENPRPVKLFDAFGSVPRYIAIVPPPEPPIRILGIKRDAPFTEVSWVAKLGRRYAVQKSPDLRFWQTFEMPSAATSERESFTDSDASATRMFYRVIERE